MQQYQDIVPSICLERVNVLKQAIHHLVITSPFFTVRTLVPEALRVKPPPGFFWP